VLKKRSANVLKATFYFQPDAPKSTMLLLFDYGNEATYITLLCLPLFLFLPKPSQSFYHFFIPSLHTFIPCSVLIMKRRHAAQLLLVSLPWTQDIRILISSRSTFVICGCPWDWDHLSVAFFFASAMRSCNTYNDDFSDSS
jgi:hypothetical protein